MKTVKVSVSELTGPALDWAVAKVSDIEVTPGPYHPFYGVMLPSSKAWRPSTDWSQGGPLIDEYQVSTVFMGYPVTWHAFVGVYFDEGNNLSGDTESNGGTSLIAACRAIVAAKLGDSVEVPAELVEAS